TADGLEIVSVSVDEPTGNPTADRKNISAFAKKIDYPFTVALPSETLLSDLDITQRAFIGRLSDLPIPSSFLLDAQRRLVAIYRGPVSADQLKKDIALIGAEKDTILKNAVPFPGIWFEPPSSLTPKHIAVTYTDNGKLQEASDFVTYLIDRNQTHPGLITDSDAADLLRIRAAVLFDLGEIQQSLDSWLEVLALNPNFEGAHLEMARCYSDLNQFEKAASELELALASNRRDPENLLRLARIYLKKLSAPAAAAPLFREAFELRPPSSPVTLFDYSSALIATKQVAQAVTALENALTLVPGWPPAANNLAWILATSPDSKIRNPAEAIRLAISSCQACNYQLPSALGTLAASYAAAGQFDKAVKYSKDAISAASSRNEDRTIHTTALANYQKNQPFLDPSLAPTPD
ncbi:MAG: tetratricopeptide repeat protein, partial [Verrucomicrobiales bacterium]|nr:tetratricopeptide repeat protein [Verrucomicrobiales bacterium]